ncbi:MAG TPA: T9SS type A sorting domain-containing protein [Flavipsychrobacter sp.]|nr:T9SS type A sorting domain-containing protein [Flavipsychrobacter sp.]
MIQLPDGTFLFDNTWGDTVVIKTQAGVGDTWLFYNDTINHTYTATVTRMDTMTILGTLDSVKSIAIHSYQHGILDTLDPINYFQMALSKNNGFVKIFDLYNFPYYSPSGVPCYDQYYTYLGSYASIFNIVAYHNPTSIEMYKGLNVGDMFAGYYGSTTGCPVAYLADYTHYDSIIYKTVIDSFHINYAIHRMINGIRIDASHTTPLVYDYIDTLHTDTSLIFLKQMPEEFTVSQFVYYYYPFDTTFCHQSPAYMSTMPWIFEGCPFKVEFKQRLLPLIDSTECSIAPACEISGDPGEYITTTDDMFYALIDGYSCDSIILPPLAVNKIVATNAINVFPNPAQSKLNITASSTIHEVTITNLLGQPLFIDKYNGEQIQIDISSLQPGIYFARINNVVIKKFVKE